MSLALSWSGLAGMIAVIFLVVSRRLIATFDPKFHKTFGGV